MFQGHFHLLGDAFAKELKELQLNIEFYNTDDTLIHNPSKDDSGRYSINVLSF